MIINCLVVDDEYTARCSEYEILFGNNFCNITFNYEFAQSPSDLLSKIKTKKYNLFVLDFVFKYPPWDTCELSWAYNAVKEHGKVAIISDKWSEGCFENLRNIIQADRSPLLIDYYEISDSGKRNFIHLNIYKALLGEQFIDLYHVEPTNNLRIVHFSDLQFGGIDTPRSRLEADIVAQKILESWPSGPDFIVITGDIAEHGFDSEYTHAYSWLEKITSYFENFSLPSNRLLIVPGNHDVCIPYVAAARCSFDPDSEKIILNDQFSSGYAEKYGDNSFSCFNKFIEKVCGNKNRINSNAWLEASYLNHGLVFVGLNTSFDFSIEGMPDPPKVCEDGLEIIQEQLLSQVGFEDDNILIIALMHHALVDSDQKERIGNHKYFKKYCLSRPRPQLLLHGHVHKRQCITLEEDDFRLLVVSASTPTKNKTSRPEDTSRGFNMIKINNKNGKIDGLTYFSYFISDSGNMTPTNGLEFSRRDDGSFYRK